MSMLFTPVCDFFSIFGVRVASGIAVFTLAVVRSRGAMPRPIGLVNKISPLELPVQMQINIILNQINKHVPPGLAERKDWLLGPCVTHAWFKEASVATLGHRMKVIALHAALLAGQGDF